MRVAAAIWLLSISGAILALSLGHLRHAFVVGREGSKLVAGIGVGAAVVFIGTALLWLYHSQ